MYVIMSSGTAQLWTPMSDFSLTVLWSRPSMLASLISISSPAATGCWHHNPQICSTKATREILIPNPCESIHFGVASSCEARHRAVWINKDGPHSSNTRLLYFCKSYCCQSNHCQLSFKSQDPITEILIMVASIQIQRHFHVKNAWNMNFQNVCLIWLWSSWAMR